jgi:hypothetical protein
MDAKNMDKDEIISLAEKTKRYCDLLIEQSDNWLSEEEGVRNVEKRISIAKRKKGKPLPGSRCIGGIISILFSISIVIRELYLSNLL